MADGVQQLGIGEAVLHDNPGAGTEIQVFAVYPEDQGADGIFACADGQLTALSGQRQGVRTQDLLQEL